ncbi:universal stress protein [Methanobacterium paludis]|uniref:UspA domain-containing protein n=1 Tax=Methanobacterium paludis (strain DSM 25820 / JCM 18151 / SWAN1) TaxID=868131 RepID=F6D520_METPW|nr:universal stress protein [Methanobacterium paludis]AEG17555.1 UspA domain-containing protein [Methanobacterium paludis]
MYEKVLIASMGKYVDELGAHTLELFGDREIEIIGVYVVETSTPFLTPTRVKEMMVKELRTRGNEVLFKLEKKLQKPNIKFKRVLVEGDPADEIIKVAENEKVNMLIMGSGKSKIDKHLLGSVTEKVVHSAPCTVLLIKTTP